MAPSILYRAYRWRHCGSRVVIEDVPSSGHGRLPRLIVAQGGLHVAMAGVRHVLRQRDVLPSRFRGPAGAQRVRPRFPFESRQRLATVKSPPHSAPSDQPLSFSGFARRFTEGAGSFFLTVRRFGNATAALRRLVTAANRRARSDSVSANRRRR